MAHYIALIRKGPGTDFGVDFPDFPGCVTAGRDLNEAMAFAREALALHIKGMREDGEAIPAPNSLEAIMADPENRDAVAVLVDAPVPKSKAVRVTITLDESLLAEVDATAAARGFTRSGFLAEGARRLIDVPSTAAAMTREVVRLQRGGSSGGRRRDRGARDARKHG